MNVVFSSSGSGGDVLPFLCLGRRLRARGHDVALISHCHYEEMAGRSGIGFSALDSPEEYAGFIEDGPLLNGPRGTLEAIRRHSLPRVLREVGLIEQRYRAEDTVLVTRDLFDLACRMASEKLGIPLLWVFGGPSQPATWKLRLPLFRDFLASDVDRIRAKLGLSPVRDWASWLGYPKRSMALWPEWFAPAEPGWPAGVVPIGFLPESECFPDDLPVEAEDMLNGEPSPVLITGGTGMYLTSEFYAASAAACRLLGLPAILVAPHEGMLPARLPDNVRWFRQLSFSRVMPRVSAVIHHGGMGTIATALAAAAPQVVLAHGADRPDNGRRLKQLGVAEVEPLPRWKPDIIAVALGRLVGSAAVRRRCDDSARRLRDCDAAAAACEIIEAAGAQAGIPPAESPPNASRMIRYGKTEGEHE